METTFLSTAKHAIPSHVPDLATLARFVFVRHSDLPDAVAIVPALCRLIAIALFIPVIALAVVDLIGWVAFKAILRPLGYAHTIRFKDPEPPSMRVHAQSGTPNHSPTSAPEVLPSSSESSSGSSDAFPSPAFSDSMPLPDSSSAGESTDAAGSRRRSSSSSTYKKPQYRRTRTGSTASSAGSDDESYTFRRMARDRAPSVGLDGPLFGDETDGMTTPGGESDASDYLTSQGSPATRLRELKGDGVPKGGFKLGLTQVQSRAATSVASD